MQERGEGGDTRNHILLLPRDLEIERQLQERLSEHRRLLEDPDTEATLTASAAYETPILERLLRVGSVNFDILALELRTQWGQGYRPESFAAARMSVRTQILGERG